MAWLGRGLRIATRLNALRAKGGKLLVVHGVANPIFSADDIADWFDTLDANHQGLVAGFARLFFVPGMGHIWGGRATDQQPTMQMAQHPLVIATPHVAGLTQPATEHQAMDKVCQVGEFLQGKLPAGCVNPQADTLLRTWL